MSGSSAPLEVRTRNISSTDEQKKTLQPSFKDSNSNTKNDNFLEKLEKDISSDDEKKDKYLWRDLVAYWFLGLTNNYGYVVMLTAAHDILKEITGVNIIELHVE